MKTLLAVAVMLVSGVALAGAPFCVKTSYGATNCWYYSADACYDAARQADGICVANVEEERPRARAASGAPFCVVTGYGRNCWYYNASTCRQAAETVDGACIVNPDAE